MGLLPAWAAPLRRPWTPPLRAPLQTFLGANFPVPASRAAARRTGRAGGIPSRHPEAGGREAALDAPTVLRPRVGPTPSRTAPTLARCRARPASSEVP